MTNCKSLLLIVFCFSSFACVKSKQLTEPAYYNNTILMDTTRISLNGYYTNISESDYPIERYPAVNPVFFASENRIYVSHGAHIDSALFTCKYYTKFKGQDFGRYKIDGNKIFGFVPVTVSQGGGAFYRQYKLNFIGVIANKTLIMDWKAVPPFPKGITESDFDNPQNRGLFKEHNLKFIETNAVNCLSVK